MLLDNTEGQNERKFFRFPVSVECKGEDNPVDQYRGFAASVILLSGDSVTLCFVKGEAGQNQRESNLYLHSV